MHGAGADALAAGTDKQGGLVQRRQLLPDFQPCSDRIKGIISYGHLARFAAFSGNGHQAVPDVHAVNIQADTFRKPQPRRIHQFQYGPVTQREYLVTLDLDQPGRLVYVQRFRQALLCLRRRDSFRRVVRYLSPGQQVPVKCPDGGQVAPQTPAAGALPVSLRDIPAYLAAVHVLPFADFELPAVIQEKRQVAGVRLARMDREVLQGSQERIDPGDLGLSHVSVLCGYPGFQDEAEHLTHIRQQLDAHAFLETVRVPAAYRQHAAPIATAQWDQHHGCDIGAVGAE